MNKYTANRSTDICLAFNLPCAHSTRDSKDNDSRYITVAENIILATFECTLKITIYFDHSILTDSVLQRRVRRV